MVNILRIKKKIKLQSKKLLKKVLLSKVFHRGFRLTVIAIIATTALYGAYALLNKDLADNVIVSESEIINRVSKHILLPKTSPISVIRVDDADLLRKQNDFYKDVKAGEYVLVYEKTIVIYDLMNDAIIAKK